MTDPSAGLGSCPAPRSLTPDQQFWNLWRQGRRPDLAAFLADRTGLTPADVAAVIAIDQYERWMAGDRVPAEQYVNLLPEGPAREQAVGDVIYGEFLLREQLGEGPDLEDYLLRFPEQAELLSRQLELHRALALPEVESSSHVSAQQTVISTPPAPSNPAFPAVPGFEILAEIGRGGMGTVYKARQLSLGRTVALKVLDLDPGSDPSSLARKRQEAENTARLAHPNIVTVHDALVVGSVFVLVMEYVAGTDLHRLVEQQGPLGVAKASEYIRQAALGLQHAHERGVIHRDIKPSNFIVADGPGGAGTVKLLDLGLARLVTPSAGQAPLTQLGAFMGTPDFIAPEQANDAHHADARSDLYSLGCTFYYLLTGRPPFHGGTPLAKLMQHHLEDPVPLDQLRPSVPAAVVAIVRRLMAKRPEDRFQTAADLVSALTALSLDAGQGSTPLARMGTVSRAPRGERTGQGELLPASNPPVLPRTPGPPVRSGLVRKLTGHEDWVKGVAFSPDGKWLATASLDRTVRLWPLAGCGGPVSPRSWYPLRPDLPVPEGSGWIAAGHTDGVLCLAFGPEGQTLVSGGEDRAVCLWDVTSRQLRWRGEGHDSNVGCVAIAPGGDRVLSSSQDGQLRLWDAATGQEVGSWQAHDGSIWGLGITPDGRTAVSGGQDRSLRLWDLSTGESLAVLPEQTMLVTCLALSPSGEQVVTGAVDGTLHLWDLAGAREIRSLEGHEGRVSGLAFSPDGSRVVSASRDTTLRIWDLATGRPLEVFTGHSRWITSVAWGTGGLIASGSVDRSVCLWRPGG